MTSRAERLALLLEGVAGAPPAAGTVHVVGWTHSGEVDLRGALLLAAADVVAVADVSAAASSPAQAPSSAAVGDAPRTSPSRDAWRPPDPALALPPTTAEAVDLAPGAPASNAAWLAERARGGAIVIRYVAGAPLDSVAAVVDEVAALAALDVAVTVAPAVPHGRRGEVAPELWGWQERLPLRGRRVLVPRSSEQAAALAMRIRSLGGVPVAAPTLEIRPGDVVGLGQRLAELAAGRFRAVAFTSPNGVAAVAETLRRGRLDARAFAAVDLIAAVGPGTSRVLRDRLGLQPDLVPHTATTEALAEAFPAGAGEAVLLPRADIATSMLPDGLQARGWEVVGVTAYVTSRPRDLPPQVRAGLAAGAIDLVPLASSSTARNFAALAGDHARSVTLVSIGPVTSATCRQLGLDVAVEARPHTLDGLVAALAAAAGRSQ